MSNARGHVRADADQARLSVTFDGVPGQASVGQTVAGYLLARGVLSWHTTRHAGRPRGVFCGIGVCFDCLVRVNGVPDVRACQRVLADGDDIATQDGLLSGPQPGTPMGARRS